MLYKVLAAAFVVASGEALRLDASTLTRRAALGAAAAAFPLAPLAAFAELKQASDGAVYDRAGEGKLNSARVIQRAKEGKLVDGSSASCEVLDKLIAVDREAIEFEKDKLDALGDDPESSKQRKMVSDAEKSIESQVKKLKALKKKKGCTGPKLKKASDAEVYERADEGKLSSARAIERAKRGELVDGSGGSCSELEAIINIDTKAVRFEKDKLAAMSPGDTDFKVVQDTSAAIEKQVAKLQGLVLQKGC